MYVSLSITSMQIDDVNELYFLQLWKCLCNQAFQNLTDTSEMNFPSIHTTDNQDQAVQYPVEFMNTLKPIAILPHS